MDFKKVTVGFVVQQFDKEGNPLSQEFVAGDEVSYEDAYGEPVDKKEKEYLPFDMVQPEDEEAKDKVVLAALNQIKDDTEAYDYSAIHELLKDIPLDILKNYCPE